MVCLYIVLIYNLWTGKIRLCFHLDIKEMLFHTFRPFDSSGKFLGAVSAKPICEVECCVPVDVRHN